MPTRDLPSSCPRELQDGLRVAARAPWWLVVLVVLAAVALVMAGLEPPEGAGVLLDPISRRW